MDFKKEELTTHEMELVAALVQAGPDRVSYILEEAGERLGVYYDAVVSHDQITAHPPENAGDEPAVGPPHATVEEFQQFTRSTEWRDEIMDRVREVLWDQLPTVARPEDGASVIDWDWS